MELAKVCEREQSEADDKRIADVRCTYLHVDLRRVWDAAQLPFHPSANTGECTQQLVDSIMQALTDILKIADSNALA